MERRCNYVSAPYALSLCSGFRYENLLRFCLGLMQRGRLGEGREAECCSMLIC